MAVLQPHWKTSVLWKQLPTLGFGLPTNTGCIFPRKAYARAVSSFCPEAHGHTTEAEAAFLQDPKETCITPPGHPGVPPAFHP